VCDCIIYIILHLAYVDTSPVHNMRLTINVTSSHQMQAEVHCRNFRSQTIFVTVNCAWKCADERIELFIYVTMFYKLWEYKI